MYAEYVLGMVCTILLVLVAYFGTQWRDARADIDSLRKRGQYEVARAHTQVSDEARAWIRWYLDRPWWQRLWIRAVVRRAHPDVPWHLIRPERWRKGRHG